VRAYASFLYHAGAAGENGWPVWVFHWRGFLCATVVFGTPFWDLSAPLEIA
jgi:hypothetical protein